MSDGGSLVLDHRAGIGRRARHPGGGRQRGGVANPVVADTSRYGLIGLIALFAASGIAWIVFVSPVYVD